MTVGLLRVSSGCLKPSFPGFLEWNQEANFRRESDVECDLRVPASHLMHVCIHIFFVLSTYASDFPTQNVGEAAFENVSTLQSTIT